MMMKKITISGVGCCLVDILYPDISFSSETMQPYLSRENGDGGLSPGHLVFVEEFESFAREPLNDVLLNLAVDKTSSKINVGGPSIVALINASQLLDPEKFEVHFYGKVGNDDNGIFLMEQLQKTSVNLDNVEVIERPTPNTVVLSDPEYDEGSGERLFINSIGAAWEVRPEDLEAGFYDSDFVIFGATALTPPIHDELDVLLRKAKNLNCTTIVNTVFDFRNEQKNPTQKWPLGKSDDSYRHIDLLIMDMVEALRLSGAGEIGDAIQFFRDSGCNAFIITDGSRDIIAYSNGNTFLPLDTKRLPVSDVVRNRLKESKTGDTTGCGDNFAGGVIASLAAQSQHQKPDLIEACSWGVVSGGFSCFYVGGTYHESKRGEKLSKLQPLYEKYREQIYGI